MNSTPARVPLTHLTSAEPIAKDSVLSGRSRRSATCWCVRSGSSVSMEHPMADRLVIVPSPTVEVRQYMAGYVNDRRVETPMVYPDVIHAASVLCLSRSNVSPLRGAKSKSMSVLLPQPSSVPPSFLE